LSCGFWQPAAVNSLKQPSEKMFAESGLQLAACSLQLLCYFCNPLTWKSMRIKDHEFKKFISRTKVQVQVRRLAKQINEDYKEKSPVFLPILNGSFMFAADLIKSIEVPCRVSFVKVSSYSGAASTGQLKSLIGLEESLFNQDIIIVEDIVDTGLTLQRIVQELKSLGTKSVEVVSLLRKQPAREKKISVKYVGFEIENEFVLGYGLDYDGLGRNFTDIFELDQNSQSPQS
jgi:hypoxanthine phosphoribosyltransferase